ncbi:hypothetical protein HJB86_27970 [Rhizobium sp. NZLR3b]|uniref:hypothetical protein n=1 Tax=Rhizobium sp. NZLR3b TaxID=2731101 RepID=UPI001C834BEA|nr:hypothetical protein [Rhizobium sp. NZLR3b]MBX5192680.1 hypothetical protein [Rhizobium sp. NZLR3b]
MSASLIYDLVPIGSIVAWSDGTTRPPARFKKKLAVWQTRNSKGRLIRKEGPRQSGSYASPGYFTLHEADFGCKNTIVMRIHRTFGLDSDLTFKVLERPALGSVRVFDRAGSNAELVHLADNREAGEAWLKGHGCPNAILEDVGADEVAAAHVEGRAAA